MTGRPIACIFFTRLRIFSLGLFSLPMPQEEEEDMLDLALGLTETSRLGCQIKVTEQFDGIIIQLPEETADMQ